MAKYGGGGQKPPLQRDAMKARSDFRVSNPPLRPLMIWDGECHFCRRWIERWREITVGQIDYATYQEAAAPFYRLPPKKFKHCPALVVPVVKTFFAPHHVYGSLVFA